MSTILVWPTTVCTALLARPVVPFDPELALPEPVWRERAAVEDDPTWQQPIPYAVLIDAQDHPWVYQRCGGDTRLQDRWSVGLGGHVEPEDAVPGNTMATLRRALLRELGEELVSHPQQVAAAAPPIAWIHEHDSAIGRVHLGLVFAIPWLLLEPPQPPRHEALTGLGFRPTSSIIHDPRLECWSRLALQALGATP